MTLETATPTANRRLLSWVDEMTELCKPDQVHWCDGSQEEYDRLCDEMVEPARSPSSNQTMRPNSFLCRSDPTDVARVEDRTFICCEEPGRCRADQQLDRPARR